ncbi:MAG: hypothetical protein J3K34DRAFT_385032 [Monoraphidium minutum]|nr:MAG: hypothetical protein J3K34DRAFT_385032 [Monoraphidium minutum]
MDGGDGVAVGPQQQQAQAQQHHHQQQQQQEEANAVCAEPKVFVGGLRYEVSQDEVSAHYSRYGPLRSSALLKHMDSGKSKGCAMVTFESWADAEAAVASENGTGTPLTAPRAAVVKFADPQRNADGVMCGVTPKKLFVGQVPPDTGIEDIRTLFSGYGAILDLNTMPPRKAGSMGCAFVTYGTWAEAEGAMKAVDSKVTMPGGTHPLTVKFADAKPAELAKFEGRGTKRGAWDGGGGMGGGKRQFMGGMGRGGMDFGGGGMGGGGMGMGMGGGPMGGGGGPAPGLGGGAPGGMGGFDPTGGMGGGMPGGGMGMGMGMPGMGMPGMGMGGMGMPGMGMGMPGMGMGMGMPGMGMGMGMGGGGGASSALAEAKAWKLFVGQISFDLSEEEIAPFLGQFGTILELALPRTDGRSRGYAFVTYASAAEAQAAIDGANGAVIPADPRARPLTVRWADNKGGGR